MSEEIDRPWKAVGLALAGFAVLVLGLHNLSFGKMSFAFHWLSLVPALVVFVLGAVARGFATVEVRLLDGIAALAFGMVLTAVSMSYSFYAVCAPLAVAAIAVAATRLVR